MTYSNYFDSVNFVVLDVRCSLLDEGLKKHELNATKYSILLKCIELGDAQIPTQDLAESLNLRPSIVTQAINDLEQRGFLKRTISPNDGREKYVSATKKGLDLVEVIDWELYASMDPVFNPDGKLAEKPFLARGLRVGGKVGGIWSQEFIYRFPTSTNFTAVSLFLRGVEEQVKETAGISLSEARILQRLGEVGEPLRISALAEQIKLPMTTITRAATKLEKRGLIQRLASPQNKKAVYIEPTEQGRGAQRALLEDFERIGEERYWGRLSESDLEATNQIRQMFLDNIVRQEETEQKKRLAELVVQKPKR